MSNTYDNRTKVEEIFDTLEKAGGGEEKLHSLLEEEGLTLDDLASNEDCYIRALVAEKGYCLDELINDEDYCVRMSVAHQGYRLDRLINSVNKTKRPLARLSGKADTLKP